MSTTDDGDLQKPTADHNKISRKEKRLDKEKDPSYQPKSLRDALERAKQNNFDAELLKVSAHDFKLLPKDKQISWLTAHFLLRKYASTFDRSSWSELESENEDEDDEDED